ncbi:MAG: polymer-forming cytoskeletal protein [Pseudomonadota bacterium]
MATIRKFDKVLAAFALLAAGAVQAGTILNFNGAAVTGCSLSGSTYTCASLAIPNFDDGITIASGYTINLGSAVNFGFNQFLTMSGTARLNVTGNLDIGDIRSANLQVSGGTLTTTGSFSVGSQSQTITANVSAATMSIGSGSAVTINGNLTSSGSVALASHATVNGAISGTTVSTSSPVVINGNVTASTSFTLASGSTMTGNIVAPTVSILSSSVEVTGNITATTSLSIGSGDTVTGDVTAATITIASSTSIIDGNATTGSITLGFHDQVTHTIYCTTSGASCNCVTNNSGYPIGDVNGPVCAAAPSSGAHHIQITHAGTGVTCTPQPLTLTACANAACTAPHYSGGVSATLTPGGAVFAIDSSGINSAASVWVTTANNPGGVALSAASSAANASTCVNTGAANSSCTLIVSAAGFLFNVPDHVAETVQSSISLSAVRMSDNVLACTPAFVGAKTINFKCLYLNPASGSTLPVRVAASSSALSSAPTILGASAASSCSAGGASLPLTFSSSGVATFALEYADVGQMSLVASYTGSGADAGLSMTGSDSFIAAPSSFGFSAIQQAAAPNLANPAAADASGASFVKAGESFLVTITAKNAAGAATPNFGRESTPEGVRLVDSSLASSNALYLDHARLVAPTAMQISPTVSTPVTPDNPALSIAAGAYSAGASVHTLAWNEAGVIALRAKLANAAGYLGTTLIPFGDSPNIGRFTAGYFTTAIAGVLQPCPTGLSCAGGSAGFVYSGQPVTTTVSAFSLANTALINYGYAPTAANTFGRTVTLGAWDAAGSTAVANPPASPAGSAISANTVAVFASGAATLAPVYTFPAMYPATANLAAPTNLALRAVDSDGISSLRSSGSSVEASLMVVGGRLLIAHNYGSELLTMPVNLTVQYWNGSQYILSSTDSGTNLLPSYLTPSACRGNLKLGAGCKAVVAMAASPASALVNGGLARLRMAAPGAGNSGSVDLRANAPTWLPSNTARLVFGIYKSPLLYSQEVY